MTISNQPPRRWAHVLLAAAVAIVGASVYRGVLAHGFVNVDDQEYVYANPRVLAGLTWSGVAWAFTAFHADNWHPLTWLVHMAEVSLFGPAAAPQHVISVALHLASTLLLLGLLLRTTGARLRSAAVAALFAVHPLAVESVAWISEQKSLLSTVLLLAALHAHVSFVRRPSAARYAATIAAFALGLLAKPMLVTLPFVLLLLDAWPLGRIGPAAPAPGVARTTLRRAVVEKLPFLALSAAACAITIAAQSERGAVQGLVDIPLGARIANAIVSYVVYLARAVWPARLAEFYPHPFVVSGGVPAWQVLAAALVLIAVSWAALRLVRPLPWLAFGWTWYLGTLVPVLGLVQVGSQAQADRYTYVPLIGVYVIVAWGAGALLEGRGRVARVGSVVGCGAVLAALAIVATAQVATWRDSVTLHRHAIQVTDRNYRAWAGLGDALLERGQLDEAIAAAQEALRIAPGVAEPWNTLGVAHGRLGRHDVAITEFGQAIRARPSFAQAWYNLGTAYGTLGDHRQALASFEQALRIAPLDARSWANLVVAHVALGEIDEARAALAALAPLDPDAAQRLSALVAPSR